jgi:hypothetical protein
VRVLPALSLVTAVSPSPLWTWHVSAAVSRPCAWLLRFTQPRVCRAPRSQKKRDRELAERDFREAAAAYKAHKRELGAQRFELQQEARRERHQELIDTMAAMEPSWVHPDEVEERIIHALDNPIRIDV